MQEGLGEKRNASPLDSTLARFVLSLQFVITAVILVCLLHLL